MHLQTYRQWLRENKCFRVLKYLGERPDIIGMLTNTGICIAGDNEVTVRCKLKNLDLSGETDDESDTPLKHTKHL